MKVAHALAWYFPDTSGGTEVYVDGLARELRRSGIETVVAAAREGENETSYQHNGIPVFRYPLFAPQGRDDIRGTVPHGGFERFARWLESHTPDVYHQHTWSRGCGLHHLRFAKQLGIATVLTVHVPGNVCLRGTMMLFGKRACDGRVDEVRCGGCWVEARGLPAFAARVLARVPRRLSAVAAARDSASRAATALATRALVAAHRDTLREATQLADRVVAVCGWLYDVLRLNGVPKERLVLCRQGVAENASVRPVAPSGAGRALKVGFLGRADPTKGLHVLVRAVRALPQTVPVELRIHAMAQGIAGRTYLDRVKREADDDTRIRFEAAIAREEVPKVMASLDLLAVPSQWLESGPLVVLEAQAMGVPVLGSDLGGIRELVQDGVNGRLVPAAEVAAWAEALAVFAKSRARLEVFRHNIAPVRTMANVATEMTGVYRALGASQTPLSQ
jgi:glycosyltransferase involved in cell wall biosynthesis